MLRGRYATISPGNSPRLLAESYCEAMARKIVTGLSMTISPPAVGRLAGKHNHASGPGR
ncbi:hypothetical protein MPS_3450 [Mycobacterium pseudoshottsii JCM 15466]|nr:hypothetical protein MPS_3450 [Mycobacterium pseudoshottsii JCM 15466]